jgi:hypothetical protein
MASDDVLTTPAFDVISAGSILEGLLQVNYKLFNTLKIHFFNNVR